MKLNKYKERRECGGGQVKGCEVERRQEKEKNCWMEKWEIKVHGVVPSGYGITLS